MNSKDSSLSNSDSESTHTNVAKTTKLPTDTKIIDEKVLGQGEEKYRLVFDSINEGIAFLGVIYSPEGTPIDYVFIDLNSAYENIFGIRKLDRIGKSTSEFFDQANFFEAFSKAALTNKPVVFETYAAYIQRFLKIFICPIKKEVLITIISDITDLKMSDEALRESDARRRSLFTYMLDGYAYCQMVYSETGKPIDFIYLETNEAFEKLTGLKNENVTGKKISEIIPEAIGAAPEVFEIYSKVALTGKAERFEFYFSPLNRWFDISVFSPKKGFFISVFDNITDRKQMQAQLEKYATNLERLVDERTKQLKEAERLAAIGQTAGVVAHDIRDPLQSIVNELYLVKSELSDLPASCDATSIKDSISSIEKRVSNIVKVSWDLQDFTRPLKPNLTNVDLCKVMPEVVSSVEVPENIDVKITCDKKMTQIKLDSAFFKRILTNLVVNAIDAMPYGGTLIINAFPKDDKATITVKDTSSGFSEEVKSKLWSPLFTTDVKWQGFGLAVAKRLTESLGGTISFESEIGKGTQFTLEFPLI